MAAFPSRLYKGKSITAPLPNTMLITMLHKYVLTGLKDNEMLAWEGQVVQCVSDIGFIR